MSHSLTPVQPTATHQWSHSDYHLRDGDFTHIQRLSRQETSDGLGQVKRMIELLKTVIEPQLGDVFCPRLFQSLSKTINVIEAQMARDASVVSNRLDGSLHDYFLTPIEGAITLNGQCVHPSLFLADIITLIAEIEAQKASFERQKAACSQCPEGIRPTDIMINGQCVQVSNAFEDSSYTSTVAFDPPYTKDVPLMILMDEVNNANTLVSLEDFQRICASRSKNHPISRRPLTDVNCMVLSPINQNIRTCLAVSVKPQWFYKITQEIMDGLGKTQWLTFPKTEEPNAVYLNHGKTPEDVCREWMAPADMDELTAPMTSFVVNEDREVARAFQHEGEYLVSYTPKTLQIARVFLRIRQEAARCKHQLTFQDQCLLSETQFNGAIDGLDPLKQTLAAYLELLQIKTALYAHFNQPLPEQPVSLWQVFQSLKMERAYV